MRTLERKNIMIDSEKWEALKIISEIGNESISKIISFAVDKYINDEMKDNLAFKLKMIAIDKYVSNEEEEEIIEALKSMSDDDLKPVEKLKI